jgi:ureidoacrylate peracid hydrolase
MPAWLDYPGSIPYDAARAALVLGKPTHALHAALEVDGADAVVDKYRYSALIRHSSPLERILKSTKIDTLIITGTLTNACCESTARDAHMMGYKVIFVSDATATITDLEHNATLLNLCVAFADIRTTAEVLGIVSRSVRQSN